MVRSTVGSFASKVGGPSCPKIRSINNWRRSGICDEVGADAADTGDDGGAKVGGGTDVVKDGPGAAKTGS
ncbi:unnamed protein product [Orchesella dallaii]|uniref:Uncharacterized protein n=1 Tax=Orchesella dallaii TaxID=48710 RepID=A0ABP1Q168_9HEXA